MKELERRKSGRLTFLPLNRLRVEEVVYPNSNDVRSLISVALNYDDLIHSAILQVIIQLDYNYYLNTNISLFILYYLQIFSKKILAKDLESGAKYSREFNLDAVTRDGDVVNRKGGFEGGYRDDKVSKILNVINIKETANQLTKLELNEMDINIKIDTTETEVNKILRDMHRIESEKTHLRENISRSTLELSLLSKQYEIGLENIKKRQQAILSMENEIIESEKQILEYEREMSSKMNIRLADSERLEIKTISERSQNFQVRSMIFDFLLLYLKFIQDEIERLDAEVLLISNKRDIIKSDLRNNLIRQRDDFELQLLEFSEKQVQQPEQPRPQARRNKKQSKETLKDINVTSLDLEYVEEFIRESEVKIRDIDNRIQLMKEDISINDDTIDYAKSEESKLEYQITEGLKTLERLLNKRSILYDNSQEKQRAIRELGTLSRKEFEVYKNYIDNQLLSSLKLVNEQFKKISGELVNFISSSFFKKIIITILGINRKAFDQYTNFNQQRQQFLERYELIESDKNKIYELISGLDQQKEETIWRTFQDVSRHFTDVFHELVPNGSGSLIMTKASDINPNEKETIRETKVSSSNIGNNSITTNNSQSSEIRLDQYTGIKIIVSFDTKSFEEYDLNQLSGGQKSLVALTLIFAIQRLVIH